MLRLQILRRLHVCAIRLGFARIAENAMYAPPRDHHLAQYGKLVNTGSANSRK
jgi:hypothetical protein